MNKIRKTSVLLIGSSFSAMPMLEALRQCGAYITVIGLYPSDPCHIYADASIFEDYSDWETLLRVCDSGDFDYIVPSCNDYAYLSAAKVSEKLGFSGLDDLETTQILHTKDRFRKFCADINVPAPKFLGSLNENTLEPLSRFEGPVILKPVDSFSGRGVQVVSDKSELQAAAKQAFAQSRSKSAVVEEYVEGSLHSHTAFVASGRVIWHDFVDEFCDVYAYQVDRSVYPSCLAQSIRTNVQHAIEKIVTSLPLQDGLLHTQFMVSGSSLWIIECMRRCPGDLYGHHFKLALNYDYEANYVAGFIGELAEAPQYSNSNVAVQRNVISMSNASAFFGISSDQTACKNLYVPLKDSGLAIEQAPFDKAGIWFSYGPKETLPRAAKPEAKVYSNLVRSQ